MRNRWEGGDNDILPPITGGMNGGVLTLQDIQHVGVIHLGKADDKKGSGC